MTLLLLALMVLFLVGNGRRRGRPVASAAPISAER
jgi:hypothetical protein